MLLSDFTDILSTSTNDELLLSAITKNKHKPTHLLVKGLAGSARALCLARIQNKCNRTMLVVLSSQDEAEYITSDLSRIIDCSYLTEESDTTKRSKNDAKQQVVNASKLVYLFPASQRRRQKTIDEAYAIERTQVLTTLSENKNCIVVTFPEALKEPIVRQAELTEQTITLNQGEQISIEQLSERLAHQGFTRVDFVYEPGQYAIRGGIFDIFSFNSEYPYRLDFFGDEIDTIRLFDIETQLSKQRTDKAIIVPELNGDNSETTSLSDYLPNDTLVVIDDISLLRYSLADTLLTTTLGNLLTDYTTVELAQKSFFGSSVAFSYSTLPQPVFHKNFDLLCDSLHEYIDKGYKIYISSDYNKQIDRIEAILNSKGMPHSFEPVRYTLHSGFIDNDRQLLFLTDHQIFERYHKAQQAVAQVRRSKALITLKELNQLQVGDYVVHVDHGIGKFGGLIHTTINGKPQEVIKLIYRNQDSLFVSIHNLHRISKYKGKEGVEPHISKLGSGSWERLKERTKQKVKDIARDLIKLYATRRQQAGFQFSPDSYMQHELEASFLYEDTPDQQKATVDVKHDMESPAPMDRLICGDVGFGKTEVAMRAAFKAATDGKQVAVLVPTTVLALQHYNTFKERFSQFPVRIEYLSRAKSAKDVQQILSDLKEGKIDIIIGTHKLVGKSVQFKDLGLLIIDEEQKFGVAVKERLRQMRVNVDTLTLTATPIPRTLQFSLLGARDLSIINTPPPNRYPVQTEVITPDDEDIIAEALRLELNRNGQVFVVNNLISTLPKIEQRIRRLCPEARIAVAHGQMPTDLTEQILTDFINYDYDILISTSIIESGVDIPNVNTIIINSANHFGLSDLHQLRGRVGRSNRKAYCYLVAPASELITPDARRRLQAIETFAELGSGFQIAMQDLDIRGAGNMLGAEQSGFIAELGYETYQRILSEAMLELREEEGMSPTENEEEKHVTENDNWVTDSQLETDLEICFPSDYVENVSERITLYRELDSLRNEDELREYTKRLIDRFGTMPPAAEELLLVVRLRWKCIRLGIEKIFLKAGRMLLYFPQNDQSPYFMSDTFGNIISYISFHPRSCRLKEQEGKHYAVIENIKSVGQALSTLEEFGNWKGENGK